jgi:hypothetical protein
VQVTVRLLVAPLCAAGCLNTPPMVVPIDAEPPVDASPLDASLSPCISGFDEEGGTFEDTRLAGDGRLILAEGVNNGAYLSPIVEAADVVTWSRLSWTTTAPTLKPLPDDGAADAGYEVGFDMADNVLLLHLDERAPGVFADGSPSGLDGECGEVCPTLGHTALFGSSARFGGANQRVTLATASAIEPTSITIAAWAQRIGAHNDGSPFSAGSLVARGHSTSGPPYSSYSVEQVENHDGQVAGALRCYFGAPSNGGIQIVGTSPHLAGVYHVACTYDDVSGIARLYVNGVEEASGSEPAAIDYVGDPFAETDLTIGTWGFTSQRFNGNLDEVAVFDRALSAAEIRQLHRRGALRARVQLRTCDDPACDGEDFVGANGGPGNFYTEACFPGAGPPSDMPTVDLDCDADGVEDDGGDVAITPNRYAQLRIQLESDVATESPRVISASLCAE